MSETSEGRKSGSQDRRGPDRRDEERRESEDPIEGTDRRSGPARRIGSRRTGAELKFCSGCGTKMTGVATIPVSKQKEVTLRLCPDCARKAGY